jgi:hypothetical protein
VTKNRSLNKAHRRFTIGVRDLSVSSHTSGLREIEDAGAAGQMSIKT